MCSVTSPEIKVFWFFSNLLDFFALFQKFRDFLYKNFFASSSSQSCSNSLVARPSLAQAHNTLVFGKVFLETLI